MITAAASAATWAGVRRPRGRNATATARITAPASSATLIGASPGCRAQIEKMSERVSW